MEQQSEEKKRKNRFGAWALDSVSRLSSLRFLLLAGGASTSFLLVSSLAVYSDTQTSTNNQFTTGSVVLGLNPTTTSFNVTNMKPGDVVYAPLTISNNGTLDFTYTMSATATNADSKGLAAALVGEVRKTPNTTCNSTTFGASSTTLVSNTAGLASLAASSRSLAAGANEVACFQVTLPSNAANSTQGATTTAAFIFNATQA